MVQFERRCRSKLGSFPAANLAAGVLVLTGISTVVLVADTGNTIANQFSRFGFGF